MAALAEATPSPVKTNLLYTSFSSTTHFTYAAKALHTYSPLIISSTIVPGATLSQLNWLLLTLGIILLAAGLLEHGNHKEAIEYFEEAIEIYIESLCKYKALFGDMDLIVADLILSLFNSTNQGKIKVAEEISRGRKCFQEALNICKSLDPNHPRVAGKHWRLFSWTK